MRWAEAHGTQRNQRARWTDDKQQQHAPRWAPHIESYKLTSGTRKGRARSPMLSDSMHNVVFTHLHGHSARGVGARHSPTKMEASWHHHTMPTVSRQFTPSGPRSPSALVHIQLLHRSCIAMVHVSSHLKSGSGFRESHSISRSSVCITISRYKKE